MTTFAVRDVDAAVVALLHEQAAFDRLELQPRSRRRGGRRPAGFENADRLLLRERARARALPTSGRDDHLGELPVDDRLSAALDRAARLKRDHSAERGRRVRPISVLIRGRPGVAATATPHGFACLTITHAGASNALTAWNAASASTRLLNDNSLP